MNYFSQKAPAGFPAGAFSWVGWPSQADREQEQIMNGAWRSALSDSQTMVVTCPARA